MEALATNDLIAENQTLLSAEILKIRRRLIDTTRRNNLLNYVPRKHTIEVVDESPAQVVTALLSQGTNFYFLPQIKDENSTEPLQDITLLPAKKVRELLVTSTSSFATPSSHELRHNDEFLQTPHSQDSLPGKLTKLARTAQATIEEIGINTLYLACGFLKWREVSYGEQRDNISPLVLLPLTLEKCSATEKKHPNHEYKVLWTGEEVEENIALVEKLRADLGIILPSFPSSSNAEEDQTPWIVEYLDAVRGVIASRDGWEVLEKSFIDFFSFEKLRMYHDLDPAAWPTSNPLHSNPLLDRVLFGKEESETSSVYRTIEVTNERGTWNTLTVLDADGAQMRAVLAAQAGANLVIQGPPGTGKSQTIANIIANALGRGRTVLFVSEKLAALEVVQRRLEQGSLGAFLLPLHGHKDKGKSITEAIQQRLHFAEKHKGRYLLTERSRAFLATIEDLDKYGAALTQPFRSSGYTAWDALWTYVRLRGDGIGLSIENFIVPHNLTKPFFEDGLKLLQDITAQLGTELFTSSTWYGFEPYQLSIGQRDDFDLHISKLQSIVAEARRSLHTACDALGIPPLEEVETLRSLAETDVDLLATQCPVTNFQPTAALLAPERRGLIEQMRTSLLHLADCDKQINETFRERSPFTQENATKLHTDLALLNTAGCAEIPVREAPAFQAKLTELDTLLTRLDALMLDSKMHGLPYGYTAAECAEIASFTRLLLDDRAKDLTPGALSPLLFSDEAHRALQQGIDQSTALTTKKQTLDVTLNLAAIPPRHELQELRASLSTYEGDYVRLLKKPYRDLKKRCATFCKGRASLSRLQEQLRALEEFLAEREAFTRNEVLHQLLGSRFHDTQTDWNAEQALLRWAHTIVEECPSGALLHTIKQDAGSFLTTHRPHLTTLLETIEEITRVVEVLDRLAKAPLALTTSWRQNHHLSLVQRSTQHLALVVTETVALLAPELRDERRTFASCIPLLDAVQQALDISVWLASHDRELRELLGNLFLEEATDCTELYDLITWIETVLKSGCPLSLLEKLFEEYTPARCQALITLIKLAPHLITQLKSELTALEVLGKLDAPVFFELGNANLTLEAMEKKIQKCLSTSGIAQWAKVCAAVRRAEERGLAPLMSELRAGAMTSPQTETAFRYIFFRALADAIFQDFPELDDGSRELLEKRIAEFKDHDLENISAHGKDIIHNLLQRTPPSGVARGPKRTWTEAALLNSEIAKQKRHLPPRDLFQRAGNAITALTPCVMMSPLSVAKFLAPGALHFDVVVMDEASQLRPEDCLGAFARAKQFIIVGDSKQLPPSRFFDQTMSEDDDEEEESALSENESVLDLAARGADYECMLEWHYRSQHEHLIHFSNIHCYDSRLRVFPSALQGPSTGLGVTFDHISDGCFEKGVNRREAQVIAEAVREHLISRPATSLGVGAFNRAQATLILDEVENIARLDESFAVAYDRAIKNSSEPFFVKNLENIQGDERDVIFISCTYGRDRLSGKVHQRFGPLSQDGGWRRLNVMFTRAKQSMRVFHSILPTDLLVSEDPRHRGIRMLRDVLELGTNGSVEPRGIRTRRLADSPYELEVADVIAAMGFEYELQFGVEGYRIDIAVKSRQVPGRFILAVEFDGMTYHSSKFARDRDRLREDVLRSRGWEVYRIWSSSWVRDTEVERGRLREMVLGCEGRVTRNNGEFGDVGNS